MTSSGVAVKSVAVDTLATKMYLADGKREDDLQKRVFHYSRFSFSLYCRLAEGRRGRLTIIEHRGKRGVHDLAQRWWTCPPSFPPSTILATDYSRRCINNDCCRHRFTRFNMSVLLSPADTVKVINNFPFYNSKITVRVEGDCFLFLALRPSK